MGYQFIHGNGVRVIPTQREHVDQLVLLDKINFPSYDENFMFTEEVFIDQLNTFPEGQFVALDGNRVIGGGSSFICNFNVDEPQHSYGEFAADGWISKVHNPDGEWLYATSLGVHPDYRRQGIAKSLWAALQSVVDERKLAGQVSGGMLSGYGAVKKEISAEEYYQELITGTRIDPTVSSQLGIGFEAKGLIKNYTHDPICDNYGVLIVMNANNFKY